MRVEFLEASLIAIAFKKTTAHFFIRRDARLWGFRNYNEGTLWFLKEFGLGPLSLIVYGLK